MGGRLGPSGVLVHRMLACFCHTAVQACREVFLLDFKQDVAYAFTLLGERPFQLQASLRCPEDQPGGSKVLVFFLTLFQKC